MNASLQQSLVGLFRSVSKMERNRNPALSTQAEKILSILAQIRACQKEKRNESRRSQLHAPLVRGLV